MKKKIVFSIDSHILFYHTSEKNVFFKIIFFHFTRSKVDKLKSIGSEILLVRVKTIIYFLNKF